jgi:chromosome segregation ATPase
VCSSLFLIFPKCVTLIEHYKKVQSERKELLDKFNAAATAAEEAQEKLGMLPDLQNLCRSLEEKARRMEDERNAAALDGEAKQRLLSQLDEEVRRLVADRELQAAAMEALEKKVREQTQDSGAREELKQLAEERARQKEAVAGLERKLQEQSGGEAQLREQLRQLSEERTKHAATIATFEKKLAADQQEDRALREQLEAHKRAAESLQRDLTAALQRPTSEAREEGEEEKDPEAESLRKELAAALAAKEGLAAELSLAKISKGSSAEMLNHFKDENKRLIGELKAAKELVRTQGEEHAAQSAQQQKRFQEAQEGVREKDRALAKHEETSQAEIVNLRKERATYAELMAARDAKLAQLQQAHDASERAHQDRHKAAEAALAQEKRQRAEEEQFAAERNKEQISKLSRLKEEVAELHGARQKDIAQLGQQTALVATLEHEKKRLEEAQTLLQTERDEAKRKCAQLEAQTVELTATIERQQQELAAAVRPAAAVAQPAPAEDGTPSIAEEEAKKLKVLLRMAKQHLQDYREKFNTSSQELRQEREARQKLEQETSGRERQLAESEAALEKNRAEIATLRDTVGVVKAKCMQLQQEQAEAAERYSALREKAAALAQAGPGIEEWTKQSIDREEVRCLKQEIGDLRQALLEVNEQNLRIVSEHRNSEATQLELQKARAEIVKSRSQLEELQGRVRAAEATHDKALASLRAVLQKELDAKTAELSQLEQETSAKFEELSAQLKLYRQRTQKTLEQKDLLILQLKKRLKDGKDIDLGTSTGGDSEPSKTPPAARPPAATAASAATAAAPAKNEDPAGQLGQEEMREKMAQLNCVVRDNAKLLKTYQQRISDLERGKQGGDANIAYLKNVLIRYFEKPSPENHKRLIPVLRVLLSLSDSEVSQIEAVRESGSKGWFF